jgi:hypothetical protein
MDPETRCGNWITVQARQKSHGLSMSFEASSLGARKETRPMKRLILGMLLVFLAQMAVAQDCPTVDTPLCCHCQEGHKVGACVGGAVSGTCGCTSLPNGGCSSKTSVCALHVCICCGLAKLDGASATTSLFGPTGAGTAPSCAQLTKVLQSTDIATIKSLQLQQKWLQSEDLVSNLASFSRPISAFVQWQKDGILGQHMVWATRYTGKWDADPKDDNAMWGTFEAEWNDEAIVFSKLQFHNVQTTEPDELIVQSDGTWTMLRDQSIVATGTWK